MYTSSISGRITRALFLSVLFVTPAAAQQFGNDATLFTAELSEESTSAFSSLDTLIREVVNSEYLPLEPPALSSLQWSEFGSRLELALASEHRGLRNSALRLIIAYGDNFELAENAVFNVMRLYRDGDTEQVRRMAVVALAQIQSDWAVKFLERSVRFERSPQIQHTIRAVLYELKGTRYNT